MIVVVVPDHHLQITPLGTVGEVRRTSDPKVVGPIEYRLGGGVGGQGVAYEGEQAPRPVILAGKVKFGVAAHTELIYGYKPWGIAAPQALIHK